ncbi:MAG: hypothetical protein HUJ51_04870 [Eggerthellaceae bacterium]|nr:hypothetical protein [Eggerthellaceae bacterium]
MFYDAFHLSMQHLLFSGYAVALDVAVGLIIVAESLFLRIEGLNASILIYKNKHYGYDKHYANQKHRHLGPELRVQFEFSRIYNDYNTVEDDRYNKAANYRHRLGNNFI